MKKRHLRTVLSIKKCIKFTNWVNSLLPFFTFALNICFVKSCTRSDNEYDEESKRKIASGKSNSGLTMNALIDAVKFDVVAQVVNGAEKLTKSNFKIYHGYESQRCLSVFVHEKPFSFSVLEIWYWFKMFRILRYPLIRDIEDVQ